ncbi:MAG: hypothetical protein IJG97_01255 [Bacilli bacterium]|jgi:hypothetical protein|nr:hypothetical protein [Bacilli bacterium]
MAKYNISFTFDDNNSLNDIFIRVLLREISNLKKNKNSVSLSCTYTSLNEGGNDYTFREYE